MDFTRPVQAVFPGTQGRILAVLAETTAELNLRTIARLSGVSLAQASRVLPALVDLGLIERREAPPSALFRFVPEHIAARAVTALTRARQTALDELACTAATLIPLPISVIVFGSFARGDADAESDLDVIMVRSGDVDEDDALWRSASETWRQNAQRLTGNRVEVIEVDEHEVRRLLHSGQPLWTDVQADGIVVFGTGLAELTARRIA
ncbi:MAG: helix-turn-helix domain-containing protein [Actinomycetota bacterium]|nr:helix-turn-helix domain-containing protein [Actinomycetota bacterium]